MTGRKPASAFLTAEWRNLAMLNYEVDAAILADRVPRGCELDSWDGRTFISVVGFQFLQTRVRGVAIPFHRDFEEVNLRFYVRRKSQGMWRRGVVFVKEIVPRSEEAFITEHYWGHSRQRDRSCVEYQVEHPRWRVWPGSAARLTCDVATLYGPEFVGHGLRLT